jgi:hypothetical chaperone protein
MRLERKLSLPCGIDFGTSNSSVGFFRDGAPELARVEGEAATIPSAIFIPAHGGAAEFGRQAIESYVEGENGRLFRALKSILGGELIDEATPAGGKRVPFKAILGKFLRHLKSKAEAETGVEATNVVLGRPVHFVDDDAAADAHAEAQLAQIARAQGFSDVLFQYEPIAAALDYEQRIEREEIALIADIGGGTSDFSLVKVSPATHLKADRKDDILANSGVHVGGTNLDYRLSMKRVMPSFGYRTRQRARPELDLPGNFFFELAQWHRIVFLYNQKVLAELKHLRAIAEEPHKVERFVRAVHERYGHRVAGDVEGAKIEMSGTETAIVDLSYIEAELRIETTRRQFEGAIQNECEKITKSVEQCLAMAGIAPEQVDTVFFTGGSTSIPAIARACLAPVPHARVVRGDRFASVGVGLAIDAGLKFR